MVATLAANHTRITQDNSFPGKSLMRLFCSNLPVERGSGFFVMLEIGDEPE